MTTRRQPWWLVLCKNNRQYVLTYRRQSFKRLWAYIVAVWYDLLNWAFPTRCGNACEWVYPFGFVPEADCPEHDSE